MNPLILYPRPQVIDALLFDLQCYGVAVWETYDSPNAFEIVRTSPRDIRFHV